MTTVKLGKLNLPKFAADKPIGIRGDGTLMSAQEVVSGKPHRSLGWT